MKEVYAYLRTNTIALNSMVEKRKRIRDYCTERGLILKQVICMDRGTNAGVTRNGLLSLLATLKDGDSIVVIHTDHLWQDNITHALIAYQLRMLHVEVISIDQPLYSLCNDLSTSLPAAQIDELLNLHERFSTGLRLSRGRIQKNVQGSRNCGAAPLGYKWSNGRMKVDLDTVSLVKKIFDGYLQYQSIGKLKQHLDENGFINPKGNRFSKESLRIILSNKFYAGYLDGDSKEIRGNHEPIINVDTFRAAASFLAANRRNAYN